MIWLAGAIATSAAAQEELISRSYDAFTDTTQVGTKDGRLTEIGSSYSTDTLTLSVTYEYRGKRQAVAPSVFYLGVMRLRINVFSGHTAPRIWDRERPEFFILINDATRMRLQPHLVNGDTSSSLTFEVLSYRVTPAQLSALARAERVRMRIGATEYETSIAFLPSVVALAKAAGISTPASDPRENARTRAMSDSLRKKLGDGPKLPKMPSQSGG